MRTPDELRRLVEDYLLGLELSSDLGDLEDSMRYALGGGGKRIRPVLCLATAEAIGCDPERALPAAAALELVHSFSLVHDDLPALDDDAERRGRPSTHIQWGEAIAILAGDALLGEAVRLALTYASPAVGRELIEATQGMIGGQYLDITQSGDLEALHRLKTGRLFSAAIGLALELAELPEPKQKPWRAFAEQLGLLFQLVDDLLDRDGYVLVHGVEETRRLAGEAGVRARSCLAEIDADTSVLAGIVESLAARTS
ncbi:MAG: polyprenyl synthetase family protein [Gaiellaceae bacterium]|jgi:geranylgeranyl diphosphate synthase type II